jgi:predicted dehydrogenase
VARITRCGVVGVGYLGRFHAQKYAALENAQLVGVVDSNREQVEKVAQETGSTPFSDHRQLFGQVEAVSIAVPTLHHYSVAKEFLERGIHVLIEKPITATLQEAQELNAIAKKTGALIQVGHLERFSPGLMAAATQCQNPLFIESTRLAPFKLRGSDVNVVLDLMIHDVDIILDLVKSPLRSIAASGARVLSNDIDIANARLEFENGCIANVTSSRVSLKTERKMRIFQPGAYLSVDFQARGLSVYRLGEGEQFPGVPEIVAEQKSYGESDPLNAEIMAFLDSIQNQTPVVVTGEDGERALRAAFQITDLVLAKARDLSVNEKGSPT